MDDLNIDDMAEMGDMTVIYVRDIPYFRDGSSRSGDRAMVEAYKFGESCLDKDIKIDDNMYTIMKYDLLMGKAGAFGSLIFKIERL